MAPSSSTTPSPYETGIALGSNQGDRLDNLRSAYVILARWTKARILETAPVYETPPVDVPPEFRHLAFLNSVLLIATAVDPMRVLEKMQAIERHLGRDRRREPRHGPRVIDLDIIYVGQQTLHLPELQIPHPRWAHRAFVARPLADLRPNLILPGQTQTVATISKMINQYGIRCLGNWQPYMIGGGYAVACHG